MKTGHGPGMPELTRLRADRLHRREAKHPSRLAQDPVFATTHPLRQGSSRMLMCRSTWRLGSCCSSLLGMDVQMLGGSSRGFALATTVDQIT